MLPCSEEHKEYLKRQKKEKHVILMNRILIICFFFLLWEGLSSCHILNYFLYASPSRIIKTLFSLLQNHSLFQHIWITLFEILVSFILSTLLSIMLAFLLWRFSLFAKILDPFLTILNSLPKVALGPLIIIWVGAGIPSIIFMALLISLFSTTLSIYHGFLMVSFDTMSLFKSFKATYFQIFFDLVFPSSFETIMSSLKINLSLTFTGVIMGELLVSKQGLGYLIMYGSQVFQLDLVISSIFLLGIVCYGLYYILQVVYSFIKKTNH